MSTLFEYLESKHNPSLEFINDETGESLQWNNIITQLPDLSSSKRLVFAYLDNSLTSVKMLLALIKSSHAICLLNSTLNLELKRNLEAKYTPYYIVDSSRSDLPISSVCYEEKNMKVYSPFQKEYPIHHDLKIMLSTSGTTGSSKFVKLTDFNFISNTESILDYLPIKSSDTCILNLPITYSYGLSVLLTNIARGGRIVCSNETVLSRNFWKLFEQYQCTSLAGVPYTYEMLARIGFTKNRYPSLRYMTQAGGKLNESVLNAFADYSNGNGIEFYVMYGQTEATARMSYLPPTMLKQKPGSIGTTIKNGKFGIDHSTQELIYAGPNVSCGYAENIDDLQVCKPQDSLATGDIAKVDKDGYYYITGRMKRFIKLFGNRINMDELELDLKSKLGFFAGCTGVEDKMLLIFSDNSSLDSIEIRNYISGKYQIHISVIKYIFTESIPLMSNQKINYQAIVNANGVQ